MTTTNSIDDTANNICIVPLMPPLLKWEGQRLNISLQSLDMVDIGFFKQTGGHGLERNLGTLRYIAAHYLSLKTPAIREKNHNQLVTYVDSWIDRTFHLKTNTLNHFQMHIIMDYIRKDLYKVLHIPTKIKRNVFEGQNYPTNMSNIGCASSASHG